MFEPKVSQNTLEAQKCHMTAHYRIDLDIEEKHSAWTNTEDNICRNARRNRD